MFDVQHFDTVIHIETTDDNGRITLIVDSRRNDKYREAESVRGALYHALSAVEDYDLANEILRRHCADIRSFFAYEDNEDFWKDVIQRSSGSTHVVSAVNDFRAAIAHVRRAVEERIATIRKIGKVGTADVAYLFNEGDEIYVKSLNEAGIFKSAKFNPGGMMTPPHWKFTMKTLTGLGGKIVESDKVVFILAFNGLKTFDELDVVALSSEKKTDLEVRGQRICSILKGDNFLNYEGDMTYHSYNGIYNSNATGRVLFDAVSMKQVDSNQFSAAHYNLGVREDDDEPDEVKSEQIQDIKDAWRIGRDLFGFSFKNKSWGVLNTDNVSEISWREDAFDKLVMPDTRKKMVRSLVEHHGGGFSDLIDGKGGGCIFLLWGDPGQGKTLTAEAVAERLHRPLYSVGVGELGTNPDMLEQRLKRILEMVTRWNAVLLLDEADIFLEARDGKDINRNAMVGVFLRLLEYHQGVLFLTTNRVKNLDPAFFSRISMALKFDAAGYEKRLQIWTNLLNSAGIEFKLGDITALARHEINGRQVKNAIKMGLTLAKSDNVPVNFQHINSVILETESFVKEVKGAPEFGASETLDEAA